MEEVYPLESKYASLERGKANGTGIHTEFKPSASGQVV
jgi:hypothetical protein